MLRKLLFKGQIIENCFNNSKENIIISNRSQRSSITRNSSFSSLIPMYLFGNNGSIVFGKHKRSRKTYMINETYFDIKNYPVESVTMTISSNTIILTILENVSKSIWWNTKAKFLIINENPENSCDMAREVLKTAWAFNILSVVYLCKAVNDQLFLYSFNPYSNLAPKYWNRVRKDTLRDEYWTLFGHPIEQPYENFVSSSKY